MKNPLLLILSLFIIPLSAYAQYDYYDGGYYGGSQLQVRQDINYIYYPWTLPDETNPSNYCEDPSGMTDISQIQVKLTKYTWVVDVECIDSSGSNISSSISFKNFTVINNANSKENNHPLEHYPRGLTNYCNVAEWNGQITDMPNYESIIEYSENIIESENKLEISCTNKLTKQTAKHTIIYQTEISKIEGCTDPTATNYNSQATIHKESDCQYPSIYTPTNITGSIPTTQVNKGATQWNINILTSHTGTSIDTSRVQLWEQFTVVDSSINDKTITLSLRQFDDQRLDVECTNYEITVPAEAITTTEGDTNSNPITGNFSVTGCDNSTNPQNPTNSENPPQIDFPNAELNQESQYLQIIGQKDGYYYVDLKSLTMLFFYLLLSFSFFYAIFKFFNKKIH